MTLIGIALCGFLLIALVGTEAGRTTLKVVGVLISGAIAVIVAVVAINGHQPSDRAAAAAAPQSDAICSDPTALAAEADAMARKYAPLPSSETALQVPALHNCPNADTSH